VVTFYALDSLPPGMDIEIPDLTMYQFLSDLVPGDYERITRESRLTPHEAEVLGYFLHGRPVAEIQQLVLRKTADGYSTYSEWWVRQTLKRAKLKVRDCPALGWRTAYAEDRARGKHVHPPLRVSYVEVFSQAA
jgi:hypothetical protein